jgi:putative endonuclease
MQNAAENVPWDTQPIGQLGLSSSCMQAVGKLEKLWIDAQEWGLTWMERMGMRTGRAPATAPHLITGLLGERAALFELSRRGYIVVARRWTSPRVRGDVDLVAWDGEWLCFVEVKTRTARDMRPAESAVDEVKRRMLRGLAKVYLRTFPSSEQRSIPVRFDVVSVYLVEETREFEIFKDAFGWR